MNKTAIVTGVTGQDGRLLTELLLDKGYIVVGFVRRVADRDTSILSYLRKYAENKESTACFIDFNGDLCDISSIQRAIEVWSPHEFYNLGAFTHVRQSFDVPLNVAMITGVGALNCLEAIRLTKPEIKFYQASSSEMYGGCDSNSSLNELSAMNPVSPYAAAKLYAYNMTRIYRDGYRIFACNGILFNHESAYRGKDFVTTIICAQIAQILNGKRAPCVYVQHLDFARDWTNARDSVRAMYLILQHNEPDDYVVGSGIAHTGKELWQTVIKIARDKGYKDFIKIEETNPHERPIDVKCLVADYHKAYEVLGWSPEISFEATMLEMINYYLDHPEEAEHVTYAIDGGHRLNIKTKINATYITGTINQTIANTHVLTDVPLIHTIPMTHEEPENDNIEDEDDGDDGQVDEEIDTEPVPN